MKIVLFYKWLTTGGIAKVLVNLGNYLHGQGHEVEFLLRERRGELLNELHDDIAVVELGCEELRYCILPAIRYLRAEQPDAIVAGQTIYNIVIIIANYFAGRTSTVIATEHMPIVPKLRKWNFLKRNLVKQVLVKADFIVVVSEGLREEFVSELEVDQRNVVRIYNPIIENTYLKSSER